MIADIFVLRKNSWHARLMKWTWGYEYWEFRNMCPYFWLSVFNCVFIIPIGILKFMKRIGVSFLGLIDDWQADYNARCQYRELEARRKLQREFEKMYEKEELDKEDVTMLQKAHKSEYGSVYYKAYSSVSYDIREKLNTLLDRIEAKLWDEKYEKMLAVKEAELKRQMKIKDLTKPLKENSAVAIAQLTLAVKFILKLFAGGIALGGLYLGYRGVLIAMTWDWRMIGVKTAAIIVLSIGIVALLGLSYIIVRWLIIGVAWLVCKWGPYCIPCERKRISMWYGIKSIFRFLRVFLFPFEVLWNILKAIWSGLKLLWEIIVAMKQNNCPGIEWKD